MNMNARTRIAMAAVVAGSIAALAGPRPAGAQGEPGAPPTVLEAGAAPRPLVLPRAETEAPAAGISYAKATAAIPLFAEAGAPSPGGWLDPTGLWVGVTGRRDVAGAVWYRLGARGWTPGSGLAFRAPSTFRGLAIGPDTPRDLGFVTAGTLNVRANPGPDESNPPVTTLARYDAVQIVGEGQLGDATWYRVGEGLWVHGDYVRRVAFAEPPAGVGPDEKWIDVNLSRQTLVAYEGRRPVFATLVATGLPRTPTWQGLSRIWSKLTSTKMSGGDRAIEGDYYWLDNVPHTQYFHRGFGLHGAYWHDDFGRPKSHGCVNLSPADAAWLFSWTDPQVAPGQRYVRASEASAGTWVWTHR